MQKQLQWKPASAERHLYKRIQRGHLPPDATVVDYERIIQTLLHEQTAQIYVYWYLSKDAPKPYIAIVAPINNQSWLVMFDFEGILESAYVVERPQYYLSEPAFEGIGRLGDLL